MLSPLTARLDSRKSERQAFLWLLKRNPTFLLRHTAPLLHAVARRVRTRLTPLVSSRHRRGKKWPRWLTRSSLALAPSSFAPALPRYPAAPRDGVHPMGAAAAEEPPGFEDPEDYLAEQRWGFLLDAVLRESTDSRHCLERCEHWVASHQDRSDLAWEPYSVCERVANLLVFLAVLRPAAEARTVFPASERFLVDSIDWIHHHLEYYGPSTNNHILNNARALLMAGAVSRDQATIAVGMQIFRASLPALITVGGFLRERSSHYQLVILNWMLDAWWFVAAFSGESSADARLLWGYIERMLVASSMLCDRDGRLLATIGDVSPDATPADSVARLRRLYPSSWPAPTQCSAAAQVRDGWFRLAAGNSLILGHVPNGGHPPSFPTHGHCDFPGFVWLHDGQEILTDPGRYRYTPDTTSSFQCSAAGHNVPLINGLAPLCESLTGGMWWPRPYASAELEVNARSDGIVLAHDGFGRATAVRRHTRQILPQPAALITVDAFDGDGEVDVTFCWHFGECWSTIDTSSLTLSGRIGQLKLSFEGVGGPPEFAAASGQVPGSCASRVYGQKVPLLGLFLRWRIRLPAAVSTRFCLTGLVH